MNFKKSLFVYGLIDVFAKLIGLITSPITTRLLTLTQYGAGPLLAAIWSPISLFLYFGMDWAMPYFLAKKEYKDNKNLIVNNSTIVSFVSIFLVWGLFFFITFFSDSIREYVNVSSKEISFYVLGLLPAALIYWLCYILRYVFRADSYLKISLVGRILPPLFILPILPYFEQSKRLFVSWSVGFIVSIFALFFALFEIYRVRSWPLNLSKFDYKLSKNMVNYGLVLVPAGAAYALMVVSDRLLIGYFFNTEYIAVHSIAISIGSVGAMLVSCFSLAFLPHLSSWIATQDFKKYLPKIQILTCLIACIFSLISVLSAIWGKILISFLYPSSYADAANLVPLIIFGFGLSALSQVGVASGMISQKPKYHTVIYWLALLINIFFGILLIPLYEINGAVVSTIFAEAFILISWIYLGSIKLRNLPIKWFMPILVIFTGLISILIINKALIINLGYLVILTFLAIIFFMSFLFLSIGKSGINIVIKYLFN